MGMHIDIIKFTKSMCVKDDLCSVEEMWPNLKIL